MRHQPQRVWSLPILTLVARVDCGENAGAGAEIHPVGDQFGETQMKRRDRNAEMEELRVVRGCGPSSSGGRAKASIRSSCVRPTFVGEWKSG